MVPAVIKQLGETKHLSALQFKKGVKRYEPTFVVVPLVTEHQGDGEPMPPTIQGVLKEYEGVMPDKLPQTLPHRRGIDHEIELVLGIKPPAKAPYWMAPPELAELRKQLNELLESGFIRPSKAPFGASVLFQKKQDGSLRMCVDYRALNKVTVQNSYLILLNADLFDQLSGAKYFTKLDLRSRYYQLTNAPVTFCTLMNQVFRWYLDKFVVVYLDDIMIYSSTLEDHKKHLQLVFNGLRDNQLFVKREKCSFAQKRIKFLGHIIEQGRVRMDLDKVKAIQEWKTPTSVTELRSFLGLANYYRQFVEGYSMRAVLLTELLKKGTPFEVQTDASDYALGGVLLQENHPVAYESHKLSQAERRYTAQEKKMLAVIHCLRPKLTPKQGRWHEFLAEFDFEFEHKAGKSNQAADALSRKAELAAMTYVAHISASRVATSILSRVGDLSTILVVVDRFSKYATFIPAPKYCSAEDTTQLFFKYVVKYWGVPKNIVSDQDSRFTGTFWFKLFNLLGSQLNISSSYHPQTDGQTERFNGMLEEYLCHFASVNQRNWPKLLDTAQFCFNAQKSSATNKSPFEIVTGQQPLLPHTLDGPYTGKSPKAHHFTKDWKQNIDIARVYLKKASKRMKKWADKGRRQLEFQVGDLVLVKLTKEQLNGLRGQDHKLIPKYEGPLPIVSKVGKVAYKIDLPPWMKIHPVIHVSNLKQYHPDLEDPTCNQSTKLAVNLKKPPSRVAEEILAERRVIIRRCPRLEFLVKWKGLGDEEISWEKAEDLSEFQQKIEGFQVAESTRMSTN
ncbi:Retrotransposon protein, putative, Ty3-gypsy subclass [Quillaja saponaria]|uniref:Retrotransposon protein, putative, Ty3-gypsy subclass n=1 Tax=Quillaja saponaria TaxID=32244 RepID=A0AAD7PQC1_QUISA|nr:Retrotransposon protein, putative, Ty3-gypsy subclass [Quillaja saponaria]